MQPTESQQMTKADLIDAITTKLGGSKAEAGRALEAVTEVLQEALTQGEEIKLPGFGVFAVTERAASEGRNPRTGEKIAIPASKVVKFKAGATLKKAVGGEAETAA
jgi:DNA-binding protein HU-beta